MRIFIAIIAIMTCPVLLSAQQEDSTSFLAENETISFLKNIDKKIRSIRTRIGSKPAGYLHKLQATEKKILQKTDGPGTSEIQKISADIDSGYSSLRQKISRTSGTDNELRKFYSGYIDTIKTTLKFLLSKKPGSKEVESRSTELLNELNGLQNSFTDLNTVQQFIDTRKAYLHSLLEQSKQLQSLKALDKQLSALRSEFDSWKDALNTPGKLERKVLRKLSESKYFSRYFSRYSAFASIFGVTAASENGIQQLIVNPGQQTRSLIAQEMERRLGSGININAIIDQSSKAGPAKPDLPNIGSGEISGGDKDLPGAMSNAPQQGKKKFKRIQYGFDLQSNRSTNLLPGSVDLGLLMSYRITEKFNLGTGLTYKAGLGKDIRKIVVTHEGMGARLFVEGKLKGSFWIVSNAELNYMSAFRDLSILGNFSRWQRSFLLGLKKTFKAKGMTGNLSLLYDFLYKEHPERPQQLSFRIGYTLK